MFLSSKLTKMPNDSELIIFCFYDNSYLKQSCICSSCFLVPTTFCRVFLTLHSKFHSFITPNRLNFETGTFIKPCLECVVLIGLGNVRYTIVHSRVPNTVVEIGLDFTKQPSDTDRIRIGLFHEPIITPLLICFLL